MTVTTPIAPKLVLLQSEDHAAFPKRNHCRGIPSRCHFLLQSSVRTMSFSLFQAKRHLPCHCWLDLADLNLPTFDLVGLDSAERRDRLDPHCSQRQESRDYWLIKCFQEHHSNNTAHLDTRICFRSTASGSARPNHQPVSDNPGKVQYSTGIKFGWKRNL
jgi:hypothetical protein